MTGSLPPKASSRLEGLHSPQTTQADQRTQRPEGRVLAHQPRTQTQEAEGALCSLPPACRAEASRVQTPALSRAFSLLPHKGVGSPEEAGLGGAVGRSRTLDAEGASTWALEVAMALPVSRRGSSVVVRGGGGGGQGAESLPQGLQEGAQGGVSGPIQCSPPTPDSKALRSLAFPPASTAPPTSTQPSTHSLGSPRACLAVQGSPPSGTLGGKWGHLTWA